MMKLEKIILILFTISIISLVFTGCKENRTVLNIYNWGDYIDPTVIEDFENEYGIKVNYSTFATNEDMYVKLKSGAGNYDIAFPSDYMIERMINEDMLYELDKNNIPNFRNIDERFTDLSFDPGNKYSVPYLWGTVGILYNKNVVKEKVNSWNILWDKKYKDEIIMLDSQRDSIGVALKKLGYSMNSRNIGELEKAKKELIRQKPLVYTYVIDEVKDLMVAEEAGLAVVWSGDATAAIRDNKDLEYIIPKEGSNIWFDNIVIPKTSGNKKEAELFIDFMCRPDIAVRNTDYIGYSTANKEAIKRLPEDIKNSKVAYPSNEELDRCEIFKDPSDFITQYDIIWTEIKAEY